MEEITHRACSKCGLDKPRSDFHRDKTQRGGIHPVCKACKRAAVREIRSRDPEATRAAQREYRKANAERIRELDRLRDARDREKRRNAARAYNRANAALIAEKQRAYYRVNKQQVLAYGKAWRKANRDKANAYRRKAMAKNPLLRTAANQRRRARLAAAATGPINFQELWTGVCAICLTSLERDVRYPDPRSPSIDHIVALANGGAHAQDNLQWTHLMCNVRKGIK